MKFVHKRRVNRYTCKKCYDAEKRRMEKPQSNGRGSLECKPVIKRAAYYHLGGRLSEIHCYSTVLQSHDSRVQPEQVIQLGCINLKPGHFIFYRTFNILPYTAFQNEKMTINNVYTSCLIVINILTTAPIAFGRAFI